MIKLSLNKAAKAESILKFENIVKEIHTMMEHGESLGSEFLGWKDYPKTVDKKLINKITKAIKLLRKENINTLVVIGIGGSYIGARAGIEFIKGLMPIKQKFKVIFVGTSISSQDLIQKLKYVENKKFAINVISKSGKTLEPALAFRYFRTLLEEQVGKNNASKYIFVTSDANHGALVKYSKMNKYTSFIVLDSIGGRFSVLTAVGLLPMAFAGCNITEILNGAKFGYEKYSNPNLKKNIAYKYAVARFLLGKKYNIELFSAYEPRFEIFIKWCEQLFGESEGKNEKGIFPAGAIFTRDLHSIGQYIQEGKKQLFETIFLVEETELDAQIIEDAKNYDGLNYLVHRTINEVNSVVARGVADAHFLAGKVPNINITLRKTDEFTLGELFYFFMRACAMSAYLLNVNPFNQPGVEIYKLNAYNLLEKKH